MPTILAESDRCTALENVKLIEIERGIYICCGAVATDHACASRDVSVVPGRSFPSPSS